MSLLRLRLKGPIGTDKAISLRHIRQQVTDAPIFDRVHIELDTGGGSNSEAYAIYEFVRALPVQVSAHVERECASAGVVIFMAAALRTASPEASIMIHPSALQRCDLEERMNATSLQEKAEALRAIDARTIDLLSARTGYDRTFFEEHKSTEADFGIVDLIVSGVVHEISGRTGNCLPDWPMHLAALKAQGRIVMPEYLCSENYLAACTASRYFRQK